MKRLAIVVALFVFGPRLCGADDRNTGIVACTASGRCVSVPAGATQQLSPDMEFAWIWTFNSVPRRIQAKDLQEALKEPGPADRQSAEVRLRPSRVLEDESPFAIAAPVEMWGEVPEELLPRFPCNETISIPAGRGSPLRVRVVSDSRTSLWTDYRVGSHDIALFALNAREIIVLDFAGKPLADARVSILHVGSGFERSRFIARQDTDRSGRLIVPNALGMERAALVITHSDHAPATVSGRIEDLPEQVKLGRGAALSGRVTRREGTAIVPVGGAVVSLESWIDGSSALYAKEVQTSADGSFLVSSVPHGTLSVSITRDGLARWSIRTDVKSDIVDLDVAMHPEIRTVLRIEDDTGQPVSNANLNLEGTVHRADKSGRMSLPGVDGERDLTFSVSAPGMLTTDGKLRPPLQSEIVVTMQRGVTLRGSCVTLEDRTIDNGRVTARIGSTDKSVTLADGGAFEFILPPRQHTELSISSKGASDLHMSVETGEPGTTIDLGRLVLHEGFVVRGRVVDSENRPIAIARVWTIKASAHGAISAWVRGQIAQTTTSEDGSFELKGLDATPVTLRVEASGFARFHTDVTPDRSVAKLEVGDLTLTRGGVVTVEADRSDEGMAEIDLRGLGLPADLLAVPVSNGVARFRSVAPGDYRVRVRQGRLVKCDAEVHVREDADAQVNCTREGVTVNGRVLVGERSARGGSLVWSTDDAAPTQAMILTRYSPAGLKQQQSFGGPSASVVVVVEDDGSFSTTDLRPGKWNVAFASLDGAITKGVVVDVPRKSDFACTVRYLGGEIRGVVLAPDGQPQGYATVTDIRDGHSTRTRSDGAFVLSGLGGGVARVVAETSELLSDVIEREIKEGTPGSSVELRLQRRQRSTIPIRVRNSVGGPASGAFVFVEMAAHPAVILTTGMDGSVHLRLPVDGAPRLRVAVIATGEWFLGDWEPLQNFAEGISIQVTKGGSILLRGTSAGRGMRLISAAGWNLSAMLQSLGVITPQLGPTVTIGGLPPGTYALRTGGQSRMITVDVNRVTTVDLNK